jgi:hypothetical protein
MTPVRFGVSVRETPADAGSASWDNGIAVSDGIPTPLTRGTLVGPVFSDKQWLDSFGERSISEYISLPAEMCPIDAACGIWDGPWIGIEETFLGVRFSGADGLHYGWIRLHMPVDPLVPPEGVNFFGQPAPYPIDFAYESTPNTPIIAGAIPEPATWALLIIGAVLVALRKLWRHTATCAVTVLLPIAAQGEVIYRSNPDLDQKQIDLDGNGLSDFRFWSMPDISLSIDHILTSVAGVDGFSSSGLLARDFGAARVVNGTIIGASPPGGALWVTPVESHRLSTYTELYGWSGDWGLAGEGVIGVSFQSELGLHYGWIRLNLHSQFIPVENEGGFLNGYLRPGPVIHDWAFESTPNTPIVAGAVPEPAAWVLAIVLAVAVACWKLRRGVLLPVICLVSLPVAANGEVVHRTPARPGSWEPFDLDGNGGLDFSFGVEAKVTSPDHLSIYFAIEQAGGAGGRKGVLTDGELVPALPAGFVIGPDPAGLAWNDDFVDREIPGVSPVGDLTYMPPSPATQFIGVRFRADDGLHYGWIRLARNYWAPYDFNHPNWPDNPGSVFNYELPRIDHFSPGVIDWAYESTPNMPIVAGAIPEQGSIVLILAALVMGCVVSFCWRLQRGRDSESHEQLSDGQSSHRPSAVIPRDSSFPFILWRRCCHEAFSHRGACRAPGSIHGAGGARRPAGGHLDRPRRQRRRRGLEHRDELECGCRAEQRHRRKWRRSTGYL